MNTLGNVATIAGMEKAGFLDGPGKQAMFDSPEGIALNEQDGSVFVVDKGNNRIRKISANGTLMPHSVAYSNQQ